MRRRFVRRVKRAEGAREVQLVTAMLKQDGAKVSQRLALTGGKVEAVGCWAGRAQKVQVADGAAVGFRITAQPLRLVPGAWLRREWLR